MAAGVAVTVAVTTLQGAEAEVAAASAESVDDDISLIVYLYKMPLTSGICGGVGGCHSRACGRVRGSRSSICRALISVHTSLERRRYVPADPPEATAASISSALASD